MYPTIETSSQQMSYSRSSGLGASREAELYRRAGDDAHASQNLLLGMFGGDEKSNAGLIDRHSWKRHHAAFQTMALKPVGQGDTQGRTALSVTNREIFRAKGPELRVLPPDDPSAWPIDLTPSAARAMSGDRIIGAAGEPNALDILSEPDGIAALGGQISGPSPWQQRHAGDSLGRTLGRAKEGS